MRRWQVNQHTPHAVCWLHEQRGDDRADRGKGCPVTQSPLGGGWGGVPPYPHLAHAVAAFSVDLLTVQLPRWDRAKRRPRPPCIPYFCLLRPADLQGRAGDPSKHTGMLALPSMHATAV